MWLMQYLVCNVMKMAMLDVPLTTEIGFSFTGEVRDPFGPVIEALAKSKVDVTSIDAPSSWNIESGPPNSGPGMDFNPTSLVSLTAPKPLTKWFQGRHFLGGR